MYCTYCDITGTERVVYSVPKYTEMSIEFSRKFRPSTELLAFNECAVLGCVTQCSQSAAHSYEQFLQVQQIVFVTLGPLRHA